MTTTGGQPAILPSAAVPRQLWVRQIVAIVRLELRRALWSKRAFILYALAGFPVFITFLGVLFGKRTGSAEGVAQTMQGFAFIFSFPILRGTVFLGCVWLFMNLIRGEIIDRTLHYLFLAPVDRRVLVVGKYIAGVLIGVPLFGATVVLAHSLAYLPTGHPFTHLDHLVAYIAVAAFAVVGYGSVFVIAALVVRNPIVPAVIVWLWEAANPFLPVALKKISVIHYVQSLLPVTLPLDTVAILAEPTPAWISVPALLVLTAAVLWLATRRVRKLELTYSGD